MSESDVVFCVEWGVSPIAHAGKCFPRMKTFGSAYDARDFFDGIDLKTIFEICIEEHPALATAVVAKKFCYVGERDADECIVPVAFLDRVDYDYGDFVMGGLERSESRW